MFNMHTHCFTLKHLIPKVLVDAGELVLDNLTDMEISPGDDFHIIASSETQNAAFQLLQSNYPDGTRFVLLPMDFNHAPSGPRIENLREQLAGLHQIKEANPNIAYPFGFADPRNPNVMDELKLAIDDYGFYGCKIYPSIGYVPGDNRLDPVYEYLVEKNKPVISHGSRGAKAAIAPLYAYFKQYYPSEELELPRRLDWAQLDAKKKLQYCNDPRNFEKVLSDYRELRIAIAHLGGDIVEFELTQEGIDLLKNEDRVPDRIIDDLKSLVDTRYFGQSFKDAVQDTIGKIPSRIHYETIKARARRTELSLSELDNLYEDRNNVIDDNWTAYLLYLAREYDNCYIDCSCTFPRGISVVKKMLEDPILQTKILFGSDWYMTTLLGDRCDSEYEIELMIDEFGEEGFKLMSETNPENFLQLES